MAPAPVTGSCQAAVPRHDRPMPTDLPPDMRIREVEAAPGPGYTRLVAEADGAALGWLTWSQDSGTVEDVLVVEHARRRGVATALWRAAAQLTPRLRHDGEEITDVGLAWARTVGGRWNTGSPPAS